MLLGLHGVLCVVLLTFPKRRAVFNRFYVPSFLVVWIGYLFYEYVFIPRNCTGECNIRVDLLLIYPYLLLVSLCAVAYFALSRRTGPGSRNA